MTSTSEQHIQVIKIWSSPFTFWARRKSSKQPIFLLKKYQKYFFSEPCQVINLTHWTALFYQKDVILYVRSKNRVKTDLHLGEKIIRDYCYFKPFPYSILTIFRPEIVWCPLFRNLSLYRQPSIPIFYQIYPSASVKKLFLWSFVISVHSGTTWGEATRFAFLGFKIDYAVDHVFY